MNEILRCMIIDDEPPAIRLLEKFISKVGFIDLVASSSNPVEALQMLGKEDIDVVFLDIQMPVIDGLQLSKIIDKSTKIIFTTAYSEYALQSYDVDAVDYLLKPFSFERFYQAVIKVKGRDKKAEASDASPNFVFIKTDGKNNLEKVVVEDISYVESLRNYVAVHQDGRHLITYSTLKSFEENLPSSLFVKIHKSYLVALRHISKTTSISVVIGDKELPIGNTYKEEFFRRLEHYRL